MLLSPQPISAPSEELDATVSMLTVNVANDSEEEPTDSFDVLAARWTLGDYRLSITWKTSRQSAVGPLGSGVLTPDSNGEVSLGYLGLNLTRFEDEVQLGADLRLRGECGADEACGDLLVDRRTYSLRCLLRRASNSG